MHTLGPWRVEERPMSQRHVYGADTLNGGELIVAEVGGHAAKQHDANAKLIAAAPQLLKRCQRMAQYLESLIGLKAVEGPTICHELVALRTVIAQATEAE